MNNAYCNGWGKIYLTDDVLEFNFDNPWDATPTFWDIVVGAVYVDSPSCPTQQTPTLVVSLYLDSSPGADACHPPVVDQQTKPSEGKCQTAERRGQQMNSFPPLAAVGAGRAPLRLPRSLILDENAHRLVAAVPRSVLSHLHRFVCLRWRMGVAADVMAVEDVVSKGDYLSKESVWVVVDAEDAAARTLSDAGARVRF